MEKTAWSSSTGTGGSKANSGSSSSSSSSSSLGRTVSGKATTTGRQYQGSNSPAMADSSRGSMASSPSSGSGNRGVKAGTGPAGKELEQQTLEGTLSKYTNLIQGWQSRYFLLEHDSGLLQYFVNEQSKNQKPRGFLSLMGAKILISEEEPNMFTIYSTNGEFYKLRAADAKERKHWVSHLQACIKYHTDSNAKASSSGRAKSVSLLPHGGLNATPSSQRQLSHSGPSIITITHHKSPAAARKSKIQHPGQLHDVKEMMSHAEGQQKTLVHSIESLPSSGPLSALDQDLLLLKATSAATLSCLGECLNLLQQSIHQVTESSKTLPSDATPVWHGRKSISSEQLKNQGLSSLLSTGANFSWPAGVHATQGTHESEEDAEHLGPTVISPEDEATDTEDNEEEDLGVMDEQRSVILHLLSQLKLGMDLTRVVLPTFILEKRSLLEMYANFMAHPDLFLSITAGATPEERMIRFVEYYVTSFHEGRKGAVAKKPYNPIIGETFHCSWDVPKDKVRSIRTHCAAANAKDQAKIQDMDPSWDQSERYKLRFIAEQVSHHPPVSGFYCECKEKKMCVNAHVWTKSKFMGMSIGVSMVGEGILYLLEHEEEYVFTLPSAYARSILTVPWVELGGKVNIVCAKSGYSATVTFHTKPFYGGKVHRVTAEVKHNPTSTVVCKAQGEWNGTLEFIYNNGETKVIDTTKLPVIRKKIRPLEKQGPFESRRLWQHVTNSLKTGDIDLATQHKHLLEEKQRADQRQRAATNTPWQPKYFIKVGDGWEYFSPLWKMHRGDTAH